MKTTLSQRNALILSLIVTVANAQSSWAQSKVPGIMVLSGGHSPESNHYSQYLQTKTLYEFTDSKFGSDEVKLFFGSGLRPDSQNVLPDVHRIAPLNSTSNQRTSDFIPGVINNNNSAYKNNVLNFLDDARQLPSNKNFYLLVSDHGMPNYEKPDFDKNPNNDNCIDLWAQSDIDQNAKTIKRFKFQDHCLSRSELEASLAKLPVKKSVFVMSQCFSGGFHQMSVKNNKAGLPVANPKVCGFTATNEANFASGCTADVDDARYKGYERFMTERLTGKNVVTGKQIHEPQLNLAIAHREAALEDMTIDIPITTEDYYLRQWAVTFETKNNPALKTLPANSQKLYLEALSGKKIGSEDAAVASRRAFLSDTIAAIGQSHPRVAIKSLNSLQITLGQIQKSLNQLKETNEIQSGILSEKLEALQAEIMANNDKAQIPSPFNEYEVSVLRMFQGLSRQYQSSVSALYMTRLFAPEVYSNMRHLSATAQTKIKDASFSVPANMALIKKSDAMEAEVAVLESTNEEVATELMMLQRISYYNKSLAALKVISAQKIAMAQNNLQGLRGCLSGSLGD